MVLQVLVQDQVATDEQGRRRFHGAFTGGFSAGYFNTVGSKEGTYCSLCRLCPSLAVV
jgi:G patch domain-containing protein 1